MYFGNLIRVVYVLLLVFTVVVVEAKEITLQHKGLALNANLEIAIGKKLTDGVVLITHGGLAHRDMESIVYLQTLLNESGFNTLAINLSLGLDNRHGMYDCDVVHRHRNDDAVEEINLWVNWLIKAGAKQVTLLGHSRGGAQIALYAAEHVNDRVNAVVLMAPSTEENAGAGYEIRYKQPLTPVLDRAKKSVMQGNGEAVIEHANLMFCRDTSVSAQSFISYYGADPRLDTPYLLKKISKRTLVLVAGEDQVVVGLDKKIEPLVDRHHVHMEVIDGSDHMFRDLNTDEAVEIIEQFLNDNG